VIAVRLATILLTLFVAFDNGLIVVKHPSSTVTRANEGGRIKIVCQSSTPDGQVDWLFNGTVITGATTSQSPTGNTTAADDDRYETWSVSVGSETLHYLTVNRVRLSDAGLYSCRETHMDHVRYIVTTLDSLVISEPASGRSLTLDAGGNLTLSCVGLVNSTLVWYRSGRRLAVVDNNGPQQENSNSNDGGLRRDVFSRVEEVDSDRNRRRSTITALAVRYRSTAGTYQCLDAKVDGLAGSRSIDVAIVGADDDQDADDRLTANSSSSRPGVASMLLYVAAVAVVCTIE
jgi:hypothetical protein